MASLQATQPSAALPRPFPSAVGLMIYQLGVALFVTGGKLAHLVYWDATWYRDIAVRGYQVQLPLVHEAAGGSNIAFFPAFPLWTWIVLHLVPNPDGAVLVASWIACIAMWAYFICLLRRLGLSHGWSWIALFALLVQPGTFYAIAGYSEPLFTAALLGYIHWSTHAILTVEAPRRRWLYVVLAVAHGAVLSSTRILGVPCVAFPLLLVFYRAFSGGRFDFSHERRRESLIGGTLALLSLGGFAGFLIYCAARWGRWDLYWEANRVGWNVFFDPWKLLSPSYYTDVFFVGNLSEVLGRALTAATLAGALWLARVEWKRRGPDSALPLALTMLCLGLMAETIVGSHGMHSMIRYLLPIHAILIPQAVAFARKSIESESSRERLGLRIACVLTGLWLFAVQIMFLIRYSRNEWVS